MGCKLRLQNKTVENAFFLDKQKYAVHGGGFPLRVKGIESVVGIVVVSGLRQDLDHMIIYDSLKEFIANYKQMQHASNKANNNNQISTQQTHYSIQSQKLPQKSSFPLGQSSQCSSQRHQNSLPRKHPASAHKPVYQ